MPKVSVIIPVYNVERYLRECLDSIISQTLKDIEIICVNDGSIDNSAAILYEYAEKDKRIKVVNQKNKGLSGARNIGVRKASGEYIYFMDSDDFLELQALEHLFTRANRDELDILYFDAVSFFEDKEAESKFSSYRSYYKRKGCYPGVTTGPSLLSKMAENNDWKPSAVLQFIKSSFFHSSNLSFFEGILHEDNLFSFVAALQAQRVGYEPFTFFHRRVRCGSLVTIDKSAAHSYGYFICHLEMMRFINRKKQLDSDSCKAAVELIIDAYNNALKIYCSLPRQERLSLKPPDSAPDTQTAFALLTSQAKQIHELLDLKKHFDLNAKKLNQIRSSRSYRFAQFLGRLYRMGR